MTNSVLALNHKQMISIDKSSEPDATAALLKLKQKKLVSYDNLLNSTILQCMLMLAKFLLQEQEVEKKARKQFRGLFDKKPGEISEVGTETGEGGEGPDEQSQNSGSANRERGTKQLDRKETLDYEVEEVGLLGRIWPTGRRIFTALGLNRCTIL